MLYYVLQHKKKNKQFNIQQFLIAPTALRIQHSTFHTQHCAYGASSALISESSMSTTTGLMLYQPLTS